jgi:glycosyltransferase involved in cell wall biosynthesis
MSIAPALELSFPRPRIVAILPAYNEADVIDSVIRHYVEDGVEVYLIDNCSTDGTAEIASRWLGNGLIRVERFPDDVGGSARAKKEYMWGEILRRNEQLAATLGADWYIRADADELRVEPWPGLSHAQAIALVDALGYNAVQSQVLEFRPTDSSFVSGGDPAPPRRPRPAAARAGAGRRSRRRHRSRPRRFARGAAAAWRARAGAIRLA